MGGRDLRMPEEEEVSDGTIGLSIMAGKRRKVGVVMGNDNVPRGHGGAEDQETTVTRR